MLESASEAIQEAANRTSAVRAVYGRVPNQPNSRPQPSNAIRNAIPTAAMQSAILNAAGTTQCRPFSSCSKCRARCTMPVQCNAGAFDTQPSRRGVLSRLGLAVAAAVASPQRAHAAQPDMQRLLKAFQDAMTAPDLQAAERAWTQAIEIAPDNGPAYSNRGTIRLQDGRWVVPPRDLP